ncbi:MAG: hypothetical protein Q9162_002213 [Coniocarpon cinnabarinum]
MDLPLILNLQSCITEAQKYEGAQYRERNGKRSNPNSAPVTPGGYRQPSVEDAPDSQTPTGDTTLARVQVPPPAPSPPPAANINVFDFLVKDGARSSSASARSSPEPRQITAPPPTTKKKVQLSSDAVTYGDGAISASSAKYPSDLHLAMDVDSTASHKPNTALARTPAPQKYKTEPRRPNDSKSANKSSEKKRKRPPVEELDLSESRKSSQELSDTTPAVLHSGLTGGLAKMLADKEARASASGQASPLSPKKRSRKEKYERYEKIETDSADGGRDHHGKRRKDKTREEGGKRHKRHRSDGDDAVKRLEAPREVKAIEYHAPNGSAKLAKSTVSTASTTTTSRAAWSSHSEFFLSLIDKGSSSHKGQSIWGTLKSFHDGVCEGTRFTEYEESGMRVGEEKRLLKALRMKVNSRGEVVLFARPDFEVDEEAMGRRIEAP